jgi:hypothetical protein
MAFTVPEFPLDVNVFTGPWLTRVFRLLCPGNLTWGKRGQVLPIDDSGPERTTFSPMMVLLVPALTDLRGKLTGDGSAGDVVEIPAGSGRWYGVAGVDDIGKGFDNEHRAAYVFQISEVIDPVNYAGLLWPQPMP